LYCNWRLKIPQEARRMDSHPPEFHSKTDTDFTATRLLERGSSNNDSIEIEPDYGDKRAQKHSPTWLTIHLCTLLVYTVICLSALIKIHLSDAKASKGSQSPLDMIYCILPNHLSLSISLKNTLTKVCLAPMRDAIRYEARTQHNSEKNNKSIYEGPPTLETKEAWMSLFE
jgi:hypothetical protein